MNCQGLVGNDLPGGGEGGKTKLLSAHFERSGELSQGRCEVLAKKNYRKVNVKYL